MAATAPYSHLPLPTPCKLLTFNVTNVTRHLLIFFASSGGQKVWNEPPPHPLPTPLLPVQRQMGSWVPAEEPGRRHFPPFPSPKVTS